MGNYTIVIYGTGSHHNGLPSDADKIAEKFVEELKKAGHLEVDATFTSSSRHHICAPDKNDNFFSNQK